MNARNAKKDDQTKEICIIVFPETIQKQLDIDKETWRSYHHNLINEGYITSITLRNSEALTVCIRKALL